MRSARKTTMTTKPKDNDMALEGGPPRLENTYQVTGEERSASRSRTSYDEGHRSKPIISLWPDVGGDEKRPLSCKTIMKIETWNIRSMYEGKLDLVKQEMKRNKVELLGISELRWTGKGHFESDEYKVYYSGQETDAMEWLSSVIKELQLL
jgi:hypothetical protein